MINRYLSLILFGGLFCSAVASYAEEKPFYLTLDPPAAPELEPDEALASFFLANGYKIELVAAEPLVEDPVALRWDEHGNLYVIEMRGFMPDAYGRGEDEPVGSVVRLSDLDKDGVFDHRETILDKLVLPRAIAIINEGLLVAEPPTLWLCPTPTGRSQDIDCTNKVALGNYGDQPGSVEHAENGLLMGIDNWLYNAKSRRRMRIVEGVLEIEPTLFRGQWGIAQDSVGRLFYNTNSNLLLGDAYDAQGMIRAGSNRAPGLGEQISSDDGVFSVRVTPGVNRAYVPGVLRTDGRLSRPTAASGMTLDRGGWLGRENDHQAFVTEPGANAVVQLRLLYEGLSITSERMLYPHDEWQQVEFLASTDERFRPVDVSIGPDGALYVVDMYRGIIQDHVFLTDELRAQALARGLEKPVGRGRIWRVQPTTVKPAMPVDLGQFQNADLVALLGHANGWQRDTAQRLLIGRSSAKITDMLADSLRNGPALQTIHALWTLAGRDELNRKYVRQGLARPEPTVRRAALRVGATLLRRDDLLAIQVGEDEALLQQELVLALAPHNANEKVSSYLLRTLLDNLEDKYLPSAIKAATQGRETEFLNVLLGSGKWTAAKEAQTGFVQQLTIQGFGARPEAIKDMLDVAQRTAKAEWQLAGAVLNGLFEVTRTEGFQRAFLAVEHPVFDLTLEELWPALTRARRAVTWPGDELAAGAKPLSPPEEQRMQSGKAYFLSHCATCHAPDGRGIASLAPPLVDSAWVTGPTEILAQIVLAGLQGPIEVAGQTWDGVMPGHGHVPEFTDEVGAGLLTYLHRAWGHAGRAVAPEFVAQQRLLTAEHGTLWTAEKLAGLTTNTHYQRYVGRYGRAGFGLEFGYQDSLLVVKSAIFNGPLVEQKEDFFFFEPRALNLEFVYADDGRVSGVRMLSDNGGVVLPRIEPEAE